MVVYDLGHFLWENPIFSVMLDSSSMKALESRGDGALFLVSSRTLESRGDGFLHLLLNVLSSSKN